MSIFKVHISGTTAHNSKTGQGENSKAKLNFEIRLLREIQIHFYRVNYNIVATTLNVAHICMHFFYLTLIFVTQCPRMLILTY